MKPFEFTATPEEILANPTRVLQVFSMKLTEYRTSIKHHCTGKMITGPGGFRGVVQNVSHDHVLVKSDSDGSERKLPLSASRLRQMLADETSRK